MDSNCISIEPSDVMESVQDPNSVGLDEEKSRSTTDAIIEMNLEKCTSPTPIDENTDTGNNVVSNENLRVALTCTELEKDENMESPEHNNVLSVITSNNSHMNQTTATTNTVLLPKVVATTMNQSPIGSNKIVYVKLVTKSNASGQQQSILQTSGTMSLATVKSSKFDMPSPEVELKKWPSSISEATTSSGGNSGESSKPIEHTVNLLNNNRILIKSVKSNNVNLATTTPAPMPAPIQTRFPKDDVNRTNNELKINAVPPAQTQSQSQLHTKNESNANANANVHRLTSTSTLNDIKSNMVYKIENEIETQTVDDSVTKYGNAESNSAESPALDIPKIKREIEQLNKTVNESKILAEYISDKRSRRAAKLSKSKHKLNVSDITDSMPMHRSYSPSTGSRSASKDSDRSVNSSLNSNAGKRNTRSRNTDFSAKQKRFLKGIQQVTRGTDDESENNSILDDDEDDADFYMNQDTKQSTPAERRKSMSVSKLAKSNADPRSKWDKYCWRCHQPHINTYCSTCVRSYHANCIRTKPMTAAEMEVWSCTDCVDLKTAEEENKKKKFDIKHFNKLLKYAMNRILQDSSLQQFQFPVNKTQYPDYNDIIVYPINLSKIESNIANSRYSNSEAFLSEIKWILHNCSIYFSDNYKVMRAAKALQKVCKQEIYDIETCPECYLNANTMTDNWFTETCAKPHLILWAKLKGFPYWPAKAMSINAQMVDVRFFGEHDRAHVPSKDCYLYSIEDPNPPTNKYKRNTIADCVKEVDVYIDNIKAKFGSFHYAEVKTPFNPLMTDQHLFDMIPGMKSGARGRRKSIAKSSDLTLRIVKTADNHLSVVKKDQLTKESPQIKRTIDITGDGAVSRTPTPPAPISSRRKTETRNSSRAKVSQTRLNEVNASLEEVEKKTYQVLRRKSMAVEKADLKKVGAVIFKRKSIHSPLPIESDDSNDAKQKDPKAMETSDPKEGHKNSSKKRKPSTEQIETKQVPEKRTKTVQDASKADNKEIQQRKHLLSEEEIIREENILRSVGLMKRMSPIKQTVEGTKKSSTNQKKRDARDKMKDDDSADRQSIVLVPFLEIKEENIDNNASKNVSGQNISSSRTTINTTDPMDMTSHSKEQFSVISDDNSQSIKTEIDSDDDSLMIIEDDFVAKAKESSTPNQSMISIDCSSIEHSGRGSISVRDINKMTDRESLQKSTQSDPSSRARKSFPKSTTSTSMSMLKPRTTSALNKSAPMNNMVSIPRDNMVVHTLPPLDLINTSTPPPLSIVVNTNSNVSLLSRNQTLPSTSNVSSVSSISNEPPPLSLSSIQVTSSHSHRNTNSNSDSSFSATLPTISNGMITEQMASAITDSMMREPPKLQARPKAPLRSDGDTNFPTESGSVCRTLMENAHKMTDFFRSVIEDTLSDLANTTNPEAKIRLLEIELEKLKTAHAKEIADLKANTDRLLGEMKKSMEKERSRVIMETRKQCEIERIRSVEEAKKRQWCAFCGKEAQFFCCWNTSYCDHLCQRKHWVRHMDQCTQIETLQNVSNARKTTVKVTTSTSKTDPKIAQQQIVQTNQQLRSLMSGQKDKINPNMGRSNVRVTNSPIVPGLRSILPKNAIVQQRQNNSLTGPNQPSSIAIINRPIVNWSSSSPKSTTTSLLHPNAILLTSQPSYATIANASSSSVSTGVSLLTNSHSQSQKSNVSETIIIP